MANLMPVAISTGPAQLLGAHVDACDELVSYSGPRRERLSRHTYNSSLVQFACVQPNAKLSCGRRAERAR